jgi:hypothetical protein
VEHILTGASDNCCYGQDNGADTRVSNPAGSGLGLAICKQLVTLMGGSINVTSEYGSGSKFAYAYFIGFRKCSDDELRTPTSTATPYRLPRPCLCAATRSATAVARLTAPSTPTSARCRPFRRRTFFVFLGVHLVSSFLKHLFV